MKKKYSYAATMLQYLFPSRSLTGEGEEWLTVKEWRDLEGQSFHIGKVTLLEMGCHFLDVVLAGDRYGRSVILRKMVQLFKYKRMTVYLDPLSRLLLRAVSTCVLPKHTVLCPVPLHWTRKFLRGFNQTELLAKSISPTLGMRVELLLERQKATGWQSHRHEKGDRKTAMQNVFAVRAARDSRPTHVLLIDDIFTSGATLDACACALKQAGVQWVGGLVVARR